MDYSALAAEFMQSMQIIKKERRQNDVKEAFQGETFVLHYILFKTGGVVLPCEISEAMGVSSARITAALNSLESKGLITRDIDKSDRRKIIVRLTPQGEIIASQHKERILSGMIQMLKSLGEQDAKEYVRITGRLAEMMSEVKPE